MERIFVFLVYMCISYNISIWINGIALKNTENDPLIWKFFSWPLKHSELNLTRPTFIVDWFWILFPWVGLVGNSYFSSLIAVTSHSLGQIKCDKNGFKHPGLPSQKPVAKSKNIYSVSSTCLRLKLRDCIELP